jgi:8-oxo-dGTP diphosphatase
MRMSETVLCVDACALFGDALVCIERLTDPCGIALPGGKIEPGETADEALVREVREETGLTFSILGIVGYYDAHGRDRRGRFASVAKYGRATGTPKGETSKTRVLLLPRKTLMVHGPRFVFDHARIAQDFLKLHV